MQFLLFLTHNCNLKCNYCYNGKSFNKNMKEDVAKRVVDFIYSHNDRYYRIGFFGGEPLLRFNIIKTIVWYIKETYYKKFLNTNFDLMTNGTLFDNEVMEFVLNNHINVLLSIDGIKEVHDTNRITHDGNGSYDLIMKNISLWNRLNDKNQLTIQMTVTPNTVSYLLDGIKEFYKMNFKKIIINIDFDSEWNDNNFEELKNKTRKLSEFYLDLIMNRQEFYLSIFDQFIELGMNSKVNNCCQSGENIVAIDASGNLYPCQKYVKDGSDKAWILGDVYKGYNEKRFKFINEKKSIPQDCSICIHKRRCINKCMAFEYLHFGNCSKSLLKCKWEAFLISLSDNIATEMMKNRIVFEDYLYKRKQYHKLIL